MTRPIYTTNHEYTVVPYSTEWPKWYESEESIIASIFGEKALSILHIGSTSIPGMAAKPQLDILVLVKEMGVVDDVTSLLIEEGYTHHGEVLGRGGRLFSRWEGNRKTVNLHIYLPDTKPVWEFIATRDYLISHPEEARAYAELKLDLQKKYPNDYLKYREHKDPWIDALQERMNSGE